MSQRLVKLFPLPTGNHLQTFFSAALFSSIGFYLLQYIPMSNPGAQIPEFPVILLLTLVTPFLLYDVAKRGYHFLHYPRKGTFLYTLGLSWEQRKGVVLDELGAAIKTLRLFLAVAVLLLCSFEWLFLQTLTGSTLICVALLTILLTGGPAAMHAILQRKSEGSYKDRSIGRAGRNYASLQKRADRLIHRAARFLSQLSPRKGMVSAAVEHMWLYLFRESIIKHFSIHIGLLLGTVSALFFVHTMGEEGLLLRFLLPLVAATVALNSSLGATIDARENLHRVSYYPFSSKTLQKATRLFAATIVSPYLLIVLATAVVGGLSNAVMLYCVNAVVAISGITLVYSQLIGTVKKEGAVTPFWYPITIVGIFLLFLIPLLGAVVTGCALLLLLFLQREKTVPLTP